MSEISVVVADAQLLFADAVACALDRRDGLAVLDKRPQSSTALSNLVEAQHPDVVLLDFHLDIVPTEQLVGQLAEHHPETKTIVLSSLHQKETVSAVLAAGAVGYLPKSCDFSDLAAAAFAAQAGERPVFGDRLEHLLENLDQRRQAAQRAAERLAELTPRENQVLEWLAAGYSTDEVAEKLGARPRTITTHVANLKNKLGARTQLEAVHMAQGKAAVWPK